MNDPNIEIVEGVLRFTAEGKARYTEAFAKVGLDIDQICDLEMYREARALIAPTFLKRLAEPLEKLPYNLELECLKAIAYQDKDKLKRDYEKLLRRRRLNLRSV